MLRCCLFDSSLQSLTKLVLKIWSVLGITIQAHSVGSHWDRDGGATSLTLTLSPVAIRKESREAWGQRTSRPHASASIDPPFMWSVAMLRYIDVEIDIDSLISLMHASCFANGTNTQDTPLDDFQDKLPEYSGSCQIHFHDAPLLDDHDNSSMQLICDQECSDLFGGVENRSNVNSGEFSGTVEEREDVQANIAYPSHVQYNELEHAPPTAGCDIQSRLLRQALSQLLIGVPSDDAHPVQCLAEEAPAIFCPGFADVGSKYGQLESY